MALSGSDWVKLNQLLDEALDIDPSRRQQWVDSLPAEHRLLSETLRDLLLRHNGPETAEVLIEAQPVGARFEPLASGDLIGPYRLIRELGSGGTATVWLAERADTGLKRQVALKLPRVTWIDRALAERLNRERDILTRLDHPSIARIYDAGVDQSGRPFLALEYVEGLALDLYVAQVALPLSKRLDLFLSIARAVAFAHAHLIVHRDLKPSNVLVKESGEIRLLDFGIARLLQPESLHDMQLTRVGARALTPQYAAPEQFTGQPITVATDVYTLGVLLYWLLSTRSPYQLQSDSMAELEDAIVNRDPEPLTKRMDRRAARALKGDVEAIVAKAMSKRPQDRYETVNALIEDIERHRSNLPIRAQVPGLRYRCRKFIARNKTRVAAGTVTMLALVCGFTIAVWQARTAQAEARRAERIKSFIASIFTQAVPKQGSGGVVTASDLLAAAMQRVDTELGSSRRDKSELQAMIGASFLMLEEADKAVPVLRSALDNCERESSSYDECRLHAAVQLAGALKITGEHARALRVIDEHLPAAMPSSPHMAEDFAVGLRVRGELLGYLDRRDESEVTLLRAVDVSERALGAHHVDTLVGLQSLSYYYTMVGNREKATSVAEQAMRRARDSRSRLRPDIWLSGSELVYANALVGLERAHEAVAILRTVVEDQRKLLAVGDDQMVDAQWVLGYAQSGAGAYDEALPLMARYIEWDRERYPADSSIRAEYVLHQSIAYLGARHLDETIAAANRVAAIAAAVDDVPATFLMRSDLVRTQALVLNGEERAASARIAELSQQPIPAAFPQFKNELLAIELQHALLQERPAEASRLAEQLLPELSTIRYKRSWRLRVLSDAANAFLLTGNDSLARSTYAQARSEYAQQPPDVSVRLSEFVVTGAKLGLSSEHELRLLADAWQKVNAGSVWHGEALYWLSRAQAAAGSVERAAQTHRQAVALLKNSNLPAMKALARAAQ